MMISNPAFHAIQVLDLTPIKRKLMHPQFGEGWSAAKADAMEEQYRRFLYLQSAYPEEPTAPSLDVDTFWHYHILDTMKYAADCAQAFGYFLHHYPYLGLMDDDEPGVEIAAGERTRALYEATFGEPYVSAYADVQDADTQGAARCNALCTASATSLSAARCNALCTAAAPLKNGAAPARCQALCTAALTQAPRASQARCNALCTAATPPSASSDSRAQPLRS